MLASIRPGGYPLARNRLGPMKPFVYFAVSAALAAVFIGFPGIDRWAANLFHEPGSGFIHAGSLFSVIGYEAVIVMEWALYIGLALVVFIRLIPAARRFHARWAVIAYVVLSFGLGPGLVTNGILKSDLGRARPHQTVEFGGKAVFSPAFIPSDQCQRNCSFVSGHAAFAFALMTFVLLMTPGPARRRATAAVLLFGVMVGLGRMAQGAHWLSDVVFAGLINIAIAWLVYHAVFTRDQVIALLRRSTP